MRARFLLAAGVVWFCAGNETAAAGRRDAPILCGIADHIEFIAELPPLTRQQTKQELGRDVQVGYCYSSVFLFDPRFSLWTSRGRHVLYDDGHVVEFYELTEAQWQALLGAQYAATMQTIPRLYRFPPAVPVILVIAAIVYCLNRSHRRSTEEARTAIETLLTNPHYEEAVNLYLDHPRETANPLVLDHEAVETAVAFLRSSHGYDTDEARINMLAILKSAAMTRAAEVRQQAAQHEFAKDWDQALAGYSEAALLMEPWDPADAEFLQKCAARVRAKV